MSTILFIIVVAIICAAVIYSKIPRPPHSIIPSLRDKNIKLIFNGEHEVQICTCTHHKIKAKPDFVYEHPDKSLTVVEYKSRRKGVMPSDITQLIATAIAVNGHYIGKSVKSGYVLTGSGAYQKIDLDKSSDEMMLHIQEPLSEVRNILKGVAPTPKPTPQKCRGCGFRNNCFYSQVS